MQSFNTAIFSGNLEIIQRIIEGIKENVCDATRFCVFFCCQDLWTSSTYHLHANIGGNSFLCPKIINGMVDQLEGAGSNYLFGEFLRRPVQHFWLTSVKSSLKDGIHAWKLLKVWNTEKSSGTLVTLKKIPFFESWCNIFSWITLENCISQQQIIQCYRALWQKSTQ